MRSMMMDEAAPSQHLLKGGCCDCLKARSVLTLNSVGWMVDEEAGCDVKGRWVDKEEASWMKKERVTRALASAAKFSTLSIC
jgi:hypothetical protein